MVRDLADQIAGQDERRSRQLVREMQEQLRSQGTETNLRKLATLLSPVCRNEEVPRAELPAETLYEAAREASAAARSSDLSIASANPHHPTSSHDLPSKAARPESVQLPDPRWIIRVASVWMMKDRAGIVGKTGVAPLIRGVVNESECRLHLIGHSFGAKVILSAGLGAGPFREDCKIDSMLLLQPAISAFSFAAALPQGNGSGLYRPVLAQVRQPILTTFSENDWPLTKLFHNFLTRESDARETAPAREAGVPPVYPNPYAALGGFGPQPLATEELAAQEFSWTFLRQFPQRYAIPQRAKVIGLRSRNGQIACHGCVSNSYTWWALWNQVLVHR
jgi:hypothetical protein